MKKTEILKKADEVKVYAEKGGVKVASFEDAAILQAAESIEGVEDNGFRKLNPDGSLAKSRATIQAINLESAYANRYRVKNKKELQVVVDERAIKDQQMGRTPYAAKIPAHCIVREEGKLVYTRTIMVSDTEFMTDFTNKLGTKEMVEIAPLIKGAGTDISESEMPI